MKPFALNQEVHFEQRPFLIGFILVGIGAFVAFLGLVIGALHSVNQGVRWVQNMDQSPGDVAKAKWAQLEAVSNAGTNANNAGTNAWKDSTAPETAHDRTAHDRTAHDRTAHDRSE
jgi:hypothetical protein